MFSTSFKHWTPVLLVGAEEIVQRTEKHETACHEDGPIHGLACCLSRGRPESKEPDNGHEQDGKAIVDYAECSREMPRAPGQCELAIKTFCQARFGARIRVLETFADAAVEKHTSGYHV